MRSAIIIGATSGIGRELARILSEKNYTLGLAGRRVELLESLQGELAGKSCIRGLDLTQQKEAVLKIKELIDELGGVDLIVLSSGIGHLNRELLWGPEKETIDLNVSGFTAVTVFAVDYFINQGKGHFAAISSIAALRGDGDNPAYNASKAYQSNYLEGIQKKISKTGQPVYITDIQPGFVDTAMAAGEGLFWVASPRKAAIQIYQAITKKKRHCYITRRWRLVAWVLKLMPGFVYNRV